MLNNITDKYIKKYRSIDNAYNYMKIDLNQDEKLSYDLFEEI